MEDLKPAAFPRTYKELDEGYVMGRKPDFRSIFVHYTKCKLIAFGRNH